MIHTSIGLSWHSKHLESPVSRVSRLTCESHSLKALLRNNIGLSYFVRINLHSLVFILRNEIRREYIKGLCLTEKLNTTFIFNILLIFLFFLVFNYWRCCGALLSRKRPRLSRDLGILAPKFPLRRDIWCLLLRESSCETTEWDAISFSQPFFRKVLESVSFVLLDRSCFADHLLANNSFSVVMQSWYVEIRSVFNR